MAKGGKGRKGGGGGGKTRKYSRDNKGRFASTGSGGATARGGRLKTASGNKRKTQTMQSAAAPKGTIGKPKGLKPGTIKAKAATAKPAAAPKAAKPAKAPKGKMRATKRDPIAPNSAMANRLAMFKNDKQLTDQRTKSLREGLKKEKDPLQKITTSSAISQSQLKSKSYGDDITRMQARPILGKRTGIGRDDKPVSGPAAKRAGTIRGKVKRDLKAASKAPKALNLNAGKYKNIYIDRANTKGKAAAKPAAAPKAPKPAKAPKGTIPLSQVKRYNALDRARRREKQTYSRELSRVTGSTDRRRADAAMPKADLASRKISRIEATMRKLSNSPNTPNVPVLPRAKKVGEQITGRHNLYRRVTPTTQASRIANTLSRSRPKPPARKPLTGINSTVGRNLAGFKGLPVSLRSRKQAASAQAARRRNLLSRNDVSTGGTFKRGVNRQPNLLTGRVDRVGAGKFRPASKRRR